MATTRPGRHLLALTASVVLVAGCGPSGQSPAGAGGTPSSSRSLEIALDQRPSTLDPLAATTQASQLVVRQLDEPLVESLTGPYGVPRGVAGLALSAHPTAGATVWRLRLREGVHFQDGALFDASAVLANAQRWQGTAAGRALLPDLVAVDAPAPDLVRFILDRPDPRFSDRLASPRLGIVSPRALSGTSLTRVSRAGTGPFELREHSKDQVLIASNGGWWGSRRQLGPALDQVELRFVPKATERLRLLRSGEAQVAEGLPTPVLHRPRRDPLLTTLPGPGGTGLGLERSVRGIDPRDRIPALSGVWLTRIGTG